MEAGFVRAAGTDVFVRCWGEKGRAHVLYWHGGGGGSTEWPAIAPALEAAGYVVHAPAAPGYDLDERGGDRCDIGRSILLELERRRLAVFGPPCPRPRSP